MKSYTPSFPNPFGHRLSVLTFLLFPFLANLEAQTPPFRWAARAGGSGDDFSRGIAVDKAGNSYVTGSFHDVATFGDYTLTGGSTYDIFAAKYDSTGNLLWANQAGGNLSDYYGL